MENNEASKPEDKKEEVKKDLPKISVPPVGSADNPSEGQTINPEAQKLAPGQVLPNSPVRKPISRKTDDDTSEEEMDRRTFMKWLTLGWAAFAAILGGYGTLFLRYLFPNVLFEPKQNFRAGYPDDYAVGVVSELYKESQATWIVRDPEKIYALSTVCTHLGCTPNYLEGEEKFKCPCHGSGFYKTGINFEGPAPRPLERFKISLADDGEIVIDKTKKFQQEKGEWSDPESFVAL